MVQNLVDSQSLRLVLLEHAREEVLQRVADLILVTETELELCLEHERGVQAYVLFIYVFTERWKGKS